jgi:hypothetical protein
VLKHVAAKDISPFSINVYRKDVNVILEWQSQNATNIKESQIEHSIDGIHFSLMKIIPAISSSDKYTFMHNQPVSGNNYYRIKKVEIDGKIKYSEIVKVIMPDFFTGINVYPNPVKNEDINL